MAHIIRRLLVTCGLAIACVGCQGGVAFNYFDESPPPPRYVVVEQGHVCTPACHHYWDGGRYVVVRRGHVHGPGCGHMLTSGRWIVAISGPNGHVQVEGGPAVRVHEPPVRVVRIPPPPGPVNVYVFDRRGSKWLKIRSGHVHGAGCGHIMFEGHWCIHD
ncbi:MAG: hypothetical protein Q7R41_07965 [Phycisphaerales bacterium]|nr:hypothetical protein [Phycisphaerales bacterium]